MHVLGALITLLISSWQLCESQIVSIPGTFFISKYENLEWEMSGFIFFFFEKAQFLLKLDVYLCNTPFALGRVLVDISSIA